MSTHDKVYLVTGVTGGIGGATAAWLAKQGSKLILSGRNQAKLDEAMHIRTLQRKEKRVEEANEERKAN